VWKYAATPVLLPQTQHLLVMQPTKLLLVLPCYNEQEILTRTHEILKIFYAQLKSAGTIAADSQICYVNDGSRDRTWDIIEELCQTDPETMGVKLSRNFGHQGALLAGLLHNVEYFDCFITIDADLQDDIRAIEKMLEQYELGARVVYGVRDDRSKDTWFKRASAEGFYKMMEWMGVRTVFNHADFRLMDQRVLREFSENFREVNLFLRGIVPLIGFKSEKVYYKRLEREAGETKYPLKKMLLFAWNGVTSFSTFPMRLVLWFGFFCFLLSMGIVTYVLFALLSGQTVPGWASTLVPMMFFSGANMIAVGLIGEYIGKIYEEVKARPRYIIEKVLNESK
jgi:polyisoprenyl-phosphate glycosyltransferase